SKTPPVDRDAHLRLPADVLTSEALESVSKRAYLWRHPLAGRSFATFVPTLSVLLLAVAGIESRHDQISSTRALTVLEVLELIQKDLNRNLTVRDVSDYVLAHEECLSQHDWSTQETMMRTRSLREILTICPIQDVVLDDYTNSGPAFSVELH
ncbi:hypothetical protein LXA43DRAFT_646959, partial [Ganoderma leucocontextum]